jgi:hypothetical protein
MALPQFSWGSGGIPWKPLGMSTLRTEYLNKPGVLTAEPLGHAFVRGCGLISTDSMQCPGMDVVKRQWSFGYLVPISSWPYKRTWISQQLCSMELVCWILSAAYPLQSSDSECCRSALDLSNVILVRLISLTGGRVESIVAGGCMEHAQTLSVPFCLAQWDGSIREAYHTTADWHTSHVGRCWISAIRVSPLCCALRTVLLTWKYCGIYFCGYLTSELSTNYFLNIVITVVVEAKAAPVFAVWT